MLYNILRLLAFFLVKIVFWVKVEGKENIPQQGPLIIASNHLSNLDPIIIGAVSPRRLNFLAKQELFRNFLFASLIKKLGAFPVKRGKADVLAMKEAVRRLKKGGALILFPQGRRTRDLAKENLLTGIGFLAKVTQAPVLPVRIFGTERALPPNSFILRPVRVKVKFSQPLQFSFQQKREEIAEKIFDSIVNIS